MRALETGDGGFKVKGLGLKLQGSFSRVWGLGLRALETGDEGFRIQLEDLLFHPGFDSWLRLSGCGLRVAGCGLRV